MCAAVWLLPKPEKSKEMVILVSASLSMTVPNPTAVEALGGTICAPLSFPEKVASAFAVTAITARIVM
jgi:hypothetical protein